MDLCFWIHSKRFLRLALFFGLLFTPFLGAAQEPKSLSAQERFAQLPLRDSEAHIIAKIVTTMASKSPAKLILSGIQLNRMGNKINHVHPLRFLGAIFSEPDLKKAMHKVAESDFKWSNFIRGVRGRMKEEDSNGNIAPYVSGFAEHVGANVDQVQHYIQKKDWEGLVRLLIKH